MARENDLNQLPDYAAGEEEAGAVVLASDILPETLPVLALSQRPVFPGLPFPMRVKGEQLEFIRRVVESPSQALGLVLLKDPEEEAGPENLHAVGVAGRILKAFQPDAETAHVLVNPLERFTLRDCQSSERGLIGRVEYHRATQLSVNAELKAYSMGIIATLKELIQLNPLQSESIKLFLDQSSMDDPGQLADFAASLTTADGQELQKILETFDVRHRIDRVLVLLRKELEISKLQRQITEQIEKKISDQQRQFFLREQLKAIKQELGLEKEGKTAELEKFEERLAALQLGEEALKTVEEEIEKLKVLEPSSPEYAVSHNYLDWLTSLPWGHYSPDSFDLEESARVLNRDHFGLEDVKERILEFIAIGKLKGDISGSILCLVGPPGVGKTSIGRSVAEALGREFYRFSLGGMRDEAEIKGHRRTYIGAMPGKVIQAIKTVKTSNPVIMLDEIDKIGASFRGDPASALLEVLDPEQNSSFRDHFLDVPFDLSNVLFIATANQLDTIPGPLLDRMEIIRLSGYILQEKLEIARRYLVPKALKNHGLSRKQVSIHKPALAAMIDGYAREAGVRGLENLIKKILRKAAIRIAADKKDRVVVRRSNLETFLGQPIFTEEERAPRRPGVATGLAWTSLGGATLQVEATAVLSKRKGFQQTGQLGQVMVESSEIAYSYVMAHLEDFGAKADFFDEHFVHLHVPAGATPKDGPSAGITMATALVSMISGRKARANLGMTGELTLTGRVLAIGGVKEKVIAARRAGCKVLIFPKANEADVNELDDYLKAGLEFHFARSFDEVAKFAFPP